MPVFATACTRFPVHPPGFSGSLHTSHTPHTFRRNLHEFLSRNTLFGCPPFHVFAECHPLPLPPHTHNRRGPAAVCGAMGRRAAVRGFLAAATLCVAVLVVSESVYAGSVPSPSEGGSGGPVPAPLPSVWERLDAHPKLALRVPGRQLFEEARDSRRQAAQQPDAAHMAPFVVLLDPDATPAEVAAVVEELLRRNQDDSDPFFRATVELTMHTLLQGVSVCVCVCGYLSLACAPHPPLTVSWDKSLFLFCVFCLAAVGGAVPGSR